MEDVEAMATDVITVLYIYLRKGFLLTFNHI